MCEIVVLIFLFTLAAQRINEASRDDSVQMRVDTTVRVSLGSRGRRQVHTYVRTRSAKQEGDAKYGATLTIFDAKT